MIFRAKYFLQSNKPELNVKKVKRETFCRALQPGPFLSNAEGLWFMEIKTGKVPNEQYPPL